MWIFLFLLASVPMVYYWSDNIVTMFPQVEGYLPKSDKPAVVPPSAKAALPNGPQPWQEVTSPTGYAARLLSTNGDYYLTTGCRYGEHPRLLVTSARGAPLGGGLTLDFKTGRIPLTLGGYAGPDLINAVAQFGELSLWYSQGQAPAAVTTLVITTFSTDRLKSGKLARNLQQVCAIN